MSAILAGDGPDVALLTLDPVARSLKLAQQSERMPGRTHPAVVIEQRAVLRHGVPPMRHELPSTRRHPVKVQRVHEAVADMVIGRHIQLRLGETPHRLQHKARLKARREVGAHQVHIPLRDEQLDVFQLGKPGQPGALLGDVVRVGRR